MIRRLLTPDYQVEHVGALRPEVLRRIGVDALLLDVDGTLKRYRAVELPDDVVRWLRDLRAAGFGLCLVSNGMGRRIGRAAAPLGLPVVTSALKPLPLGCLRAVRRLGLPRRRTAMVGDQVFADVAAARLAGLLSILVRPIHPEEEPWPTRAKRPLERWWLRRLGPRPDPTAG